MGLKSWLGRLRGEDGAADRAVAAPPTEQDILAALNRVNAMLTEGNAPPVVTTRVQRIARTIRDTLPQLRNLGVGTMESYSVMATATDYLPEAVGGYLRLPRDWANSRPIEGGKTALMVLIDQLELLASTMGKMLDAANRADAQALIAHGRFLQEKFGHPSPDVPTEPAPPPRSSLDL